MLLGNDNRDDNVNEETEEKFNENLKEEIASNNTNVTEEQRKPNASWYHTVFQKRKHGFDPLVRNPAFAQGESAVYTELTLLKRHFHPTVALFASQIIDGNFLIIFY